jgi:hypothetical protein
MRHDATVRCQCLVQLSEVGNLLVKGMGYGVLTSMDVIHRFMQRLKIYIYGHAKNSF